MSAAIKPVCQGPMHQEHSGGKGMVSEDTSAIGGMIRFSEKVDSVLNQACLQHECILLALYCNDTSVCFGFQAAVMAIHGVL